MESQHNQSIQQLQALQLRLPNELSIFYQKLFQNPENGINSNLHKHRRIIVNVKNNLSQLFTGQYIQKIKIQSFASYLQLKNLLTQLLINLCHIFKLNSKFIQESNILNKININGNLKQQSNKKHKQRPFMVYVVEQIYQTFSESKQYEISSTLRNNLIKLYYIVTRQNSMPILQLQKITQLLTDQYYSNQLSLASIQTSFRLIQSGIQERSIQPYLYFIQNSPINAIKVLYNNPKWIFNKGMTLWLSFETLAMLEESNKNQCTIFLIKTQLNNKIQIKLLKNMDLVISSFIHNKETQSVIISALEHKMKMNQITTMGIQLQVVQGGFLKSNLYLLNIKINGKYQTKTILNSQKTPKFQSNQMITDFFLFDRFIGNVYSIIICNKNQLAAFQKLYSTYTCYGVSNESKVWNLVQSGILKKQNLVGIFNAQRSFEGVLINYVADKNVACFSGLVSQQKYNKYDYQIIDVLSPYLYMLIVSKHQHQPEKFKSLFDMILRQIINIISVDNQSQIISEDILFILYFLQLSQYSISQSTLNYLIEQTKINKEEVNFYFQIIGKYLDVSHILQKGLVLPEIGVNQFEVNPVQKIQLMFYLQTQWKIKWNQFQGFSYWWSPSFFQYQNDSQFDPKKYSYDQNKKKVVEWQVKNFISNDFCKAILMPIFKIPEYADLNKYQKQYISKECMLEDFTLALGSVKKGKKIVLKKQYKSSFDKIKMKLLGSTKQIPKQNQNLDKLTLLKKVSIKNQMSTECLLIDLLTVIICNVKITTSGFIIISSKHTNKLFDHLCVKAFKNQEFKYITFHLSQLKYIRKRRFNQSNKCLEIRRKNGKIYLLYFYKKNVDNFITAISEHVQVRKDPYSYYLDSQEPFQWIEKAMSNFQYIQWLNDAAGRNFLDITQYPILPWVFIANHQEEMNQEKVYRDLLKNMGSHGTEDRLRHFLQKYSSNNQQQLFNEYHFGTHYSSSAIIFNYLIRVRPFSIGAYTLQSGKFDCADRVFWSYIGSWVNATNSPTDIRELIPELYTLPEMFLNINNYDFGLTQDKLRIDNVQIPKWTQMNPYKFIAKIRKQLESNYCSQNINHWIDLIFGYKQRGKQAIQNMNIFFPLTYEDAINLDSITDEEEKISFETQIAHFGQNPSQIIGSNPHPIRMKQPANWQGRLISDGGKNILIQKCHMDKSKSAQKQQKFLYKSIFQPKNAIMSIKFLDEIHFIVIRKHQFNIFKILHKKTDFISKQQQIAYELETIEISINYKELEHYVPTTIIGSKLIAVAGFYNSYVHFLFVDEPNCNQAIKFGMSTITAIEYSKLYRLIYLADNQGYLKIFQLNFGNNQNLYQPSSKEIEFVQINSIKIHDQRINNLTLNEKANLAATCSNDGYVKLINLYSQQLLRVYRNPDFEFDLIDNGISYCQISISPLYSIVFYSRKGKRLYSYSINGQYLSNSYICQNQKSSNNHNEYIFSMRVTPSSDASQRLVLLNSMREILIFEMPFLEMKRKIKLKKDQTKVTCFECCQNGKICLTGTEDSVLQIIGDPNCY